MRSSPLHAYLHIVAPAAPANWRDSVGEWEVDHNRLYLLTVNATIIDQNQQRPARLTDFFPEASGKVFAHWYSGQLILPLGEARLQAAAPYSDQLAEFRVLTVKAGVLIDETLSKYQVFA